MGEPLDNANLWAEWADAPDTEPGCSELRDDDQCPCGSGLMFGECHGADGVIHVEPVAEFENGGKA